MSKSETTGIKVLKLLMGLMIAAALVLIYILGHRLYVRNFASGKQENETVCNLVVTDSVAGNEKTPSSDLNKADDFDVKMNAEWTFGNGKSASEDAYVENPAANSNSVFFTVSVSGLDEAVYTSPVLPPGSHLENIRFDRVLPPGGYNGVLTYHLLGAEGDNEIGSVQMALKITVRS